MWSFKGFRVGGDAFDNAVRRKILNLNPGPDFHSEVSCPFGKGGGGEVGIAVTGPGVVANHLHIIQLQQGMQGFGLFGIDDPGIDPLFVL